MIDKMKSFKVTTKHFPDTIAWYCGETAKRARYVAFLDVSDMCPSARLKDIKVRRDSRFDHLVQGFIRPDEISELVNESRRSKDNHGRD